MNDSEIQERKNEKKYEWIVPLSFKTNLDDLPTQKFILNKSKSTNKKKLCIIHNKHHISKYYHSLDL